MPTDVIMPQMGESIFEGTITKWLKKAGDKVEKDEPLFEISTDKVDAEIPSPVAGVLTEIKIAEGATVEVNTVVAVISESGAKATAPRISNLADFRSNARGIGSKSLCDCCTEGTASRSTGATDEAALLAAGAAHCQREQSRPQPDHRNWLGGAHHQGRCAAAFERARTGRRRSEGSN